jgi:hypothetical protein
LTSPSRTDTALEEEIVEIRKDLDICAASPNTRDLAVPS